MDGTMTELLVLALRALFELLVPQSLGLAAREVLIALCLAGAVWLLNRLSDQLPGPLRQCTPAFRP